MSDSLPSVRTALALLGALSLGLTSRTAKAEDSKKAECASAYERSQELRQSGKLRKAGEALVLCAQEVCPAFVRTDCVQWLTEVTHETPTVVFSVKDTKGEDIAAVHVTVDDEEVASELDGKSVAVDPGTHKFQFEIEGSPKIVQEVLIRQAEKDRVINVSFAPRAADVPEVSPYGDVSKDVGKEPAPAPASGKPGPLRPYAFVAGGVGVAGIIGFVALGAVGHSKENELNGTCGPTHTCAQSDVDGIKTDYLLADVSLGLGIAGLGAGVALFFLSQPKADPAKTDDVALMHFGVKTSRNGALGTISGRF
jgi:hypothetical protein